MKELIEKLKAIEKETSEEMGGYNLFALFLREEALNKWDILVSASWIENARDEALTYLATKIQRAFSPEQLIQISRIVIIENNNPALSSLQQSNHVEHGTSEIHDSNLFGLQIKHAFLITSRKNQAA